MKYSQCDFVMFFYEFMYIKNALHFTIRDRERTRFESSNRMGSMKAIMDDDAFACCTIRPAFGNFTRNTHSRLSIIIYFFSSVSRRRCRHLMIIYHINSHSNIYEEKKI